MKNSGVKWIGVVPKAWDKDKVFRIFGIIGGGTTPKSSYDAYYDGKFIGFNQGI